MESKLRIPRVATAVLVLGGCGGDDKSEKGSPLNGEGTDASAQRQDAVAEALCEFLIECEGRGDNLLPTCKAGAKADFEAYVEAGVTDDCMDALLDYYSCYATLSCSDLDDPDSDAIDACATESHLEQRCEGQLPDADD